MKQPNYKVQNISIFAGAILLLSIVTSYTASSKINFDQQHKNKVHTDKKINGSIISTTSQSEATIKGIDKNDLKVGLDELKSALQANSATCKTLQFTTGWNLFSVPVELDSADMIDNFQPLIDEGTLVKIQDEEGWALEDGGIFTGWKNDIGDISPTEGYKIKVNSDVSIEFCGSTVNYPYPIPLKTGWNIIGYPGISSIDAMDFIQQLIDKGILIKLQDESGQSIEDLGIYGRWQNFIGNINPGEGYKIKVNTTDTLWVYDTDTIADTPKNPGDGFMTIAQSAANSVPDNQMTVNTKSASPFSVNLYHFQKVYEGNGIDHMNFNIVKLSNYFFEIGDELAIFDNSNCVGSITINSQHLKNQLLSIPASSNDNYGMAGFAEGNPYTIRIWKSKMNKEFEIRYSYLSGAEVFEKNESVILSLEHDALLNDKLDQQDETVLSCHPNPFSDEVLISVRAKQGAELNIFIFNQSGQRIRTINSGKVVKGGTLQFVWDGKTEGNLNLSSGIYYVYVRMNDLVYSQKLVRQH